MTELTENRLFEQIACLLNHAHQKVLNTVNQTMVQTYFEIGRMIVEEEQAGNARANYAQNQLKAVSQRLTVQFGKGFSVSNLKNMRQFYLTYSEQFQLITAMLETLPPKSQIVSGELAIKNTKRQTVSGELVVNSTESLYFP